DRTGIAAYKWDVADFDACQEGVRKVEADLGPVDVLVNNAGITRDGTMRKMGRQQWDEVIDVNLGGCFNMAKAVFDGMTGRKYGRIVNIGSINGQAGQYGQVNYAAAKAGIHGFSKALAQEGARSGVTVIAIAPGYIDTDMVAAVPEDALGKIVTKIAAGRLGEAEDTRAGAGLPGVALKARADAPSWSTRMRASSLVRRCRSTAASTCIDGEPCAAEEAVGADRGASDFDQPRADVLARVGVGGARARLPAECAGGGDRRGPPGRGPAAEPHFGDPAVAVRARDKIDRVKPSPPSGA